VFKYNCIYLPTYICISQDLYWFYYITDNRCSIVYSINTPALIIHQVCSIGLISKIGILANFIKIFNLSVWGLYYPAILKLIFKRKGSWFYIRKLWPAALTFKFGHSHFLHLRAQGCLFKRYKKHLDYHGLLISGPNVLTLQQLGKYIQGARPLNSYTKRGIYLVRSKFIKRRGKESQYTKLKSKIF
jgi:hypothetical protein